MTDLHMTKSPVSNGVLEHYFSKFREQIIGIDQYVSSPYGSKKLIYADWIASGRCYAPIEQKLQNEIMPLVANTHTETSYTGAVMTHAYHVAKGIIKKHVNAQNDDVMIATGTGMTGTVHKFQRILGFKFPDILKDSFHIDDADRPVIFITHMEHHSNQTSWLETIAHVELIPSCKKGLVNVHALDELLDKHKDRKLKIASVTGCSNVTGIHTPYYDIAEKMHQAGGFCFVDFACSGPYVHIDMHPANRPEASLDAIFISPHKFLGGPGTPGILIFNKKLYRIQTPDGPGGGTVTWTNPWGGHKYIEDIEAREDGGTPGFLQLIKCGLAFQLKEEMNPEKILAREEEILHFLFDRMEKIPGLTIMAGEQRERLGAISFYVENLHYNLLVKLLNDHYGIQVRGGCSCAGTYGHFLLDIDEKTSENLLNQIDQGHCEVRPGWVRLSIHPTMTDAEIELIANALEDVVLRKEELSKDYIMVPNSNYYVHRSKPDFEHRLAESWFF